MRIVVVLIVLVSATKSVAAEPEPEARVAGEVNVLWPFFPGGLSELKVLVPAAHDGRILVGLWSDFNNRPPLRDDTYGKVATLAVKAGYRQQVAYGLRVELGFTIGWRHEAMRPNDDPVIDDLIMRAWPMVGYQRDLSDRVYINTRGGASLYLYRSSHADIERKFIPALDVNVGVRL